MKPPGILPAAYIRSSKSTVSGKKSSPGRGSERFAVPRTIDVAVADGDGAAGEAGEPAGLEVRVRPPNSISSVVGVGTVI